MVVSPPVLPFSPLAPSAPVVPVEPVAPVAPVSPFSAGAPVAPCGPAGPGTGTATASGAGGGVTTVRSHALNASADTAAAIAIEYLMRFFPCVNQELSTKWCATIRRYYAAGTLRSVRCRTD
jgi:hypothetical protein